MHGCEPATCGGNLVQASPLVEADADAVEKLHLGERVVVMTRLPPCARFYDKIVEHIGDEVDGKPLKRWMGEDQSFSIRARAAGKKLWCDTRVRAKHHTPRGHSVEDVILGLPQDVERIEGSWQG